MGVKATYSQVLVDEFDFTGSTFGFTLVLNVGGIDVTNLNSTAVEQIAGNPNAFLTMNGYYTGDDAGDWHQELRTRLGTTDPVYVALLLGTDVIGCPAFVFDETWAQQMNIEAPIEDVIKVQGEWGRGTNGCRVGERIFSGTLDATGAQTAQDIGAAGSAGGVAYLWVQDISGTATNADIAVESASTQGGAYSSEGVFTFSGVGGYRVALSGTVNRWLRVNLTDLGGADDITFVCVVAVTGVTG